MDAVVIALPKGRILEACLPLLARVGVVPEPDFFDPQTRRLRFATSNPVVEIVRVRSMDVPVFVAQGGAQLGVAGRDVLQEQGLAEIYTPLDLGIGHCRLSLAHSNTLTTHAWQQEGCIRVATKYPRLTQQYFAKQGVRAECVVLHGAMELAPLLGLAPYIVDLVSSGATLRHHDLVEHTVLMQVTSLLLVHPSVYRGGAPVAGTLLVHALRDCVQPSTLGAS